MTKAFLVISIVCAVLVLNAFFPRKDPVLLLPSFLSAWLTIELAPWLLLWEAMVVTFFATQGAIEERPAPWARRSQPRARSGSAR